jgi:hypothetical protein
VVPGQALRSTRMPAVMASWPPGASSGGPSWLGLCSGGVVVEGAGAVGAHAGDDAVQLYLARGRGRVERDDAGHGRWSLAAWCWLGGGDVVMAGALVAAQYPLVGE